MQKLVEKLVLKYKTRDPYKIAKELEIIILEENLGSIQGYYNEVLDYKFIHVNTNLTDHKKRFVVAHELGHALLHPNLNHFFLTNHTLLSIDKYEKEANLFAFKLICDENINEFETVREISCFYGLNEKLVYSLLGDGKNGIGQCS